VTDDPPTSGNPAPPSGGAEGRAQVPAIDTELLAEMVAISQALAARPDHADVARRLEWLIDTLILRGQIPKTFRRLLAKVGNERTTVRLTVFKDKYAVPSEPIDCAALAPICKVRCCSFEVALSAQDVAERSLPWDLDAPYVLPKKADGSCGCADDKGACTVYDKRPGACRAYDCRHDDRVWLDFDAKLPAP
jgi:hypothetical protein